MHYLQYRSWGAVLVITCVGIVLTTVRVVTKSVAASFLVHAGYNATLMLLAAVATDGFRHMDTRRAGILESVFSDTVTLRPNLTYSRPSDVPVVPQGNLCCIHTEDHCGCALVYLHPGGDSRCCCRGELRKAS